MQITDVSFGELIGAAAIILILIDIYNTVMTAIKNWREEKKRKNAPVATLEGRADETKQMLQAHAQMIQSDRERLTALEEQQRIMLRAMMAMLSHEIDGNTVDKLKASVTEINEWLIRK